MPYDDSHLTRITDLKDAMETWAVYELRLRQQMQALETRQDAVVTVATEDSEVIDARIDSWSNQHSSLGSAIRNGQIHLEDKFDAVCANLQTQIDSVSSLILGMNTTLAKVWEALRTLKEE